MATLATTIPGNGKRTSIAKSLSKVLADTFSLYLKTHGYHWNVTGQTFQSLHLLFEGQYRDQWAALDDIGERIRALGEFVPTGYGALNDLTAINDGNSGRTSEAMVSDLLQDNETVLATIRDAFEVAVALDDQATIELLNARTAAHEKHAWMLRATLGNP